MIVVLRGHIRNSFQTRTLYFFLKRICSLVPKVRLYVHTWNVVSNSTSWRYVERNDAPVTEDLVRAYLDGLPVRHVIVDDDRFVTLHGNLEGKVGRSNMPLLGWKNYWYGKHRILHHLLQHEPSSEVVLNCRFDVFDNSNSLALEPTFAFVQRNAPAPLKANVFLLDKPFLGVDNLYMGTVQTMYMLSRQFYFHLDRLLLANRDCTNQEYLVFEANALLFLQPRFKHFTYTHKATKAYHSFKKP